MSKIVLTGRWMWIWGTWHVAFFAGLVVALLNGPTFGAWYYGILFLVFWPLEVLGGMDRENDKWDPEREVAKTLSQWPQFLAQMAKGDTVFGWRWLAAGFGVLYGVIVGAAVTHLGLVYGFGIAAWLVGCVMGVAIAGSLAAHFGWRGKYG